MSRSVGAGSPQHLGARPRPNSGPWLEEFHEHVCNRVAGALVRRGWPGDVAWDVIGDILVDILGGELRLPDDGELGAWVFVIAKRRLISAHRRRQPVPLNAEDPDGELEPLDRLLQQERAESLHEAIRHLSEKEHSAIIGRFVDGLSYSELARLHQTTEGAVRKRIFEARRKLEQLLIL